MRTIAVFVATLMPLVAAQTPQSQEAQRRFEHGRVLYEAVDDTGKSATAAEGEFRRALRLNPRLAAAVAYLGFIAVDRGDSAEAAADYRKALRIDANCAEAHVGLGHLNMNRGMQKEAMAEFRQAVSGSPNNQLARLVLAETLTHPNQSDAERLEAIENWQALVRLDPNEREAHHELAKAYQALSRWADAEREYREVLRIGRLPDDIVVWVYLVHISLAEVLEKQGKIAEAIQEYQALINSEGADQGNIEKAEARIEVLQAVLKKK